MCVCVFFQVSRCWSSPVIGCGRVTEYAKPPSQLKARGRSSGILPLRISCVSTLMGPFQCFAACPPPLLSFISQMGYWLLAGSHYLSLKARSTQLACFVLLSLLLGFIVTFYIVSWNMPETISQFFSFCTSLGNHPIHSSIVLFFYFFYFNQTSSHQAVALLNTQPLATSLIWCYYIYLSYFSGS